MSKNCPHLIFFFKLAILLKKMTIFVNFFKKYQFFDIQMAIFRRLTSSLILCWRLILKVPSLHPAGIINNFDWITQFSFSPDPIGVEKAMHLMHKGFSICNTVIKDQSSFSLSILLHLFHYKVYWF